MPDESLYVVSYDTARTLATDAAYAAVEAAGSRSDGELTAVADNAALKASQSVADRVDAVTDEKLQQVASDASNRTLETVQVKLDEQINKVNAALDAQVQEIESRSESVQSTSVVLADEQWQYVHDSLQVQSTCSVLTMLLVAMMFGAIVTRYLVEGWRR